MNLIYFNLEKVIERKASKDVLFVGRTISNLKFSN